jgi:hypothetical protein
VYRRIVLSCKSELSRFEAVTAAKGSTRKEGSVWTIAMC